MGITQASKGVDHWIESGVAVLDGDGNILEADEPLCIWLETTPDQVEGASFWGLVEPFCANAKGDLAKLRGENQTFSRAQFERTTRAGHSGQWFILEVIRHSAGSVVRMGSILPELDVLQESEWGEQLAANGPRREIFARLLRAEAELATITQCWPGVLFSQRPDCSFFFISSKIEEFTGIPVKSWQNQSQTLWHVVHEADVPDLQEQLRESVKYPKGLVTTFRIRHVKTGKVAYIMEHRQAMLSANGLLLGYEGFWLDITRQTIAEKRLSSAAWKETLAVLTMGLAHDFSNIMAGISALSETFQAQSAQDHPFQEGLRLIQKNSIQAGQLVNRIMNLHNGKTGEKNYHDLNALTYDMTELVQKIIPRRITMKMDMCDQQLPVYVDAVEFRQVFINLSINAADAMPQAGTLVLETSLHESYPPMKHVQGVLPRLPAVCLTVRDTGCGIPENHIELLFDPFFTTKAVNKGSGLGLYNARLFAEKHHGAISIESKENEGTAFRIWLPQADFTEADRQHVEGVRRRALLIFGAPGSILDSTAELLRENGYYVVVTTSEAGALEFLNSFEYQFSGALLQSTVGESSLFTQIHRHKLPVKTILQVVGRNEDELDMQLSKRSDLIIRFDTSSSDLLARLEQLFSKNGSPKT